MQVYLVPAAVAAALWLWFLARGRARGGVKRIALRLTLIALAAALVAGAADGVVKTRPRYARFVTKCWETTTERASVLFRDTFVLRGHVV